MNNEIRKVTKDTIQITTFDERWYEHKNKFYPSVTWITDFYPKGIGFYKWLANHGWNEAESIKEAAGDRGHKVHAMITNLLKGKEININGTVGNSETGEQEPIKLEEYEALMSFADWYSKIKPETIANEIVVINEEENYAGTADYICKIKNKDGVNETWLVDFKTSQNIWPNYYGQLSAYAKGLTETMDIKIDKMAILQLNYKRNKHQKFKFTEIDYSYALFKASQLIWEQETKGIEPKKKDYPLTIKL